MDYKEKYNIKLSHQLYVCGKPYDPYQSACNERDRTLEKLANLKSKIAVPYLIDFLRNKFYKRTNLLVEEKQYLLALDALEKIGVPSLKPMEELYDEMNNFIYQLRIKGIFGTYDEVHLAGLLKKTIDRISPPQILPPEKIIVGYCNNCGRELKIKKENVKPVMNLTCKCGFHNKIETE